MKILFLIPSGSQRSQARYRVLPYVEHGLRNGKDVSCLEVPTGAYERYAFFSTLPSVDVLVVHRDLPTAFELMTMRRACKKLMFDVGDAAWTKPSHELDGLGSSVVCAKLARRFERICRTADRCLVDNRTQADRMREHRQQLHVLRTPVDVERYSPGSGGKEGGVPLVGWMGSPGDEPLLDEVMAGLAKYGGRIQFSVISSLPYEGPGAEYTLWSTWSRENEPMQLQAMDVGLVPLADDEYFQASSNVEVLRYMASGVAVVASDVGRNSEVIEHGVDGYLVQEPGDWEKYVLRLAEDPDLRKTMTTAARKKVESNYSLEKTASDLWWILSL